MGGTPGEQNRLAVHLRQRHRRKSTEITAPASLGMLDGVGLDVSDRYALSWESYGGAMQRFPVPNTTTTPPCPPNRVIQ